MEGYCYIWSHLRTHTHTHTYVHTRVRAQDSFGRGIGPSQRHLPVNTQHPVGFEPAIPASERPQTHALDRVATGRSASTSLTRAKYAYKVCFPVPGFFSMVSVIPDLQRRSAFVSASSGTEHNAQTKQPHPKRWHRQLMFFRKRMCQVFCTGLHVFSMRYTPEPRGTSQ